VSDSQTEGLIDWHFMLLGLAGRLRDAALFQCRDLLARGRLVDLGPALVAAVVDGGVPLFDVELEVLTNLLDEAGVEHADLSQVSTAEFAPASGYVFSATPEAGSDRPAGRPSEMDAAAIASVGDAAGVVGVWRAWRESEDESGAEPRWVYVAEVDDEDDMVATTARIQGALAATGDVDPQVEVYPQDSDLPTYQRFARAYGELIWARTPDPGVQVASVFDEVDPTVGPRFTADHPVADGEEVPKLLEYLRRGEGLLLTTARLDDVVQPERGSAVPMSFRTDGTWVWSDATTYYLDTHGLLPDPGLVAHIRSVDYICPGVDGPARHRAMAALQAPSDEEPAWTYGS
jgi:hypothetical protein